MTTAVIGRQSELRAKNVHGRKQRFTIVLAEMTRFLIICIFTVHEIAVLFIYNSLRHFELSKGQDHFFKRSFIFLIWMWEELKNF
jgi:hypothetical protein